MKDIEVKGHSGCQIDVVNEDGEIFVYKSTRDPKYLQRLALQAAKQAEAGKVEYQHIRVPKIFELQKKAGTTVIKMQYIYSKNFIEFFEQAGFEQVDYLIGALKYFIEYEVGRSTIQKVQPDVFRVKFADIRKKVESNPMYEGNEVVASLMIGCQKVFDNLREMEIPVGLCHGDLTFSNVLFNGNNYYLIDFLDSFVETPLQDIVKIRQDTAYRWSQLMYTKRYDEIRLRIVCDKMDAEIDRYFSEKYQWYRDNYRIMQLMNILRILPYAHEVKVINYLAEVLTSLLAGIESGEGAINEVCIEKPSAGKYSSRTLIMPIAADKPDYATRIPRVFKVAEDGSLLCIKALRSLDLNKFDNIYITILKSLDERYCLSERLRLQLKIYGINNAEIVVLDKPTASQPETIYQTIKKKDIHGTVFIKDADCSFNGEDAQGNAVAIYPLEQLDWVNPKNKSYVAVDDMYYVTNIIEKCVVSHYFTAGGYCFEDADTYCRYFERFNGEIGVYLSHIIYAMLLDKYSFRPVVTKEYEDFELKY